MNKQQKQIRKVQQNKKKQFLQTGFEPTTVSTQPLQCG